MQARTLVQQTKLAIRSRLVTGRSTSRRQQGLHRVPLARSTSSKSSHRRQRPFIALVPCSPGTSPALSEQPLLQKDYLAPPAHPSASSPGRSKQMNHFHAERERESARVREFTGKQGRSARSLARSLARTGKAYFEYYLAGRAPRASSPISLHTPCPSPVFTSVWWSDSFTQATASGIL